MRVHELEVAGLRFTGRDEHGERMEIAELSRDVHPHFLGEFDVCVCLFLCAFMSTSLSIVIYCLLNNVNIDSISFDLPLIFMHMTVFTRS